MLAPSPINQLKIDWEAPKSAYLHIPFCRRRCYYCDFPVSVVGDHVNGNTSQAIAHYVEVLCQEITQASTSGTRLETIFFGGGTPSLLSITQLNQLLQVLDQQFGIAATAEISIEMDPGTFDLEQLRGYKAAGVNRINLGVQAFQAELLATCGRTHTVADIYTAIDFIHQVEVSNFGLDLISGLPHQKLEQWQASLETAVAIAPAHLSCYDLIVEPVTAFGRQYQPGTKPLPSDETAAQMYRTAQQVLTTAGYEHYEISNYAQRGYQCRHNRVYWENRPFYGFGMGAASYLQGHRLTRPRKTREYYQWVAEQSPGMGREPANPTEQASEVLEILLDTIMLSLRLAEGLDLRAVTENFGQQTLQRIWTCLRPHYQRGWVEIIPTEGPLKTDIPVEGRIRLSDPEGFLFSNTILSDLFREFDRESSSPSA